MLLPQKSTNFETIFILTQMSFISIQELYKKYLTCSEVSTDTRKITPNSMFFALKGPNFDANTFASEALTKGASFSVVDNPDFATQPNILLVEDTLLALQQLANYHRKNLAIPFIGLTGSNGKTTTKELINKVLSKKYKTYATIGNLNNHIGVPLTVLAIDSSVEVAIIEMGANKRGDIKELVDICEPTHGFITNIGKAHLEGFGGIEGVLKGKTELYEYVAKRGGRLFVSSESDVLLNKAKEYTDVANITSYGHHADDYIQAHALSDTEFLTLKMADGMVIQSNLVGSYNADNVLAAICIGHYFGVAMTDIKTAIEEYQPTNNRSQKIKSGTNTILLDAYNANPSSMSEALKNFEQLNAPNKITILGEMMELGDYSTAEHEKIITQVNAMNVSQRVFVGGGFNMLKGAKDILYFETTEQLRGWYQAQSWEHTTQLIKGSRKNALERILK